MNERQNKSAVAPDSGDLARLYQIDESESVTAFLAENPCLLPLLKAIPPHIEKAFGKSRLRLYLSFYDSKELWISVLTDLSAREAFPLLERFDNQFWLDNLGQANGKLNVRLEYV